MKIDHIGIAVRNLEEALGLYRKLLKVKREELREVPSEKMRTAILWLENGRLELMEPLGEEGAVAGFLQRRGEGVHHIALQVEDLQKALEGARAHGFTIVGEGVGVFGGGVAFVHPKSLKGVLLELCEKFQPAQ